MKLLDTTFLIDYWAGREAVGEYLEAHDETEFLTTTINLKEIAVGRAIQGTLDPVEIRSTFEWIRLVPFRVEHAMIAGELEARLHEDGTVNRAKIRSVAGDVLIAAVATETGATVVTRNTDDFRLFEEVVVESY